MIARVGTGWQTLFADISIILFMVTAAALSQAGQGTRSAGPSPRSDPLAVYRADPGAPSLQDWLAAQPADPRQMLTIVASYRPGQQDSAMARAAVLARSAKARGLPARIVVEPGDGNSTATLAFDTPNGPLARSLRARSLDQSQGTPP
jgi:hypothetical protein